MIAHDSDTLNTGVGLEGRVIALNATVTLDTNTVSFASPSSVPEPATSVLIVSALAGLVVLGRRRRTACSS